MTPAKRSRAQAHKNSYESLDELAEPSVSRRSSNEVIRLVRPAPIAKGTTAEADQMNQRRCILTVLGKAPPPPKPMVRGRGTAQRKQHLGHNGRPPAWYHAYWRPVDSEKYLGQVEESCDLRRKLQEDNAWMVCMHCCQQEPENQTEFAYNPTTYFRKHLLSHCPAFKNSPAWASPEIVKELSKLHRKSSEVRLPCLM
jgi:hypothetical protein